jgi:phosphatidyl-myo-inositol dimannoside synthase
METPRILFLTPGCFDKGGISRYSRYQITALRRLFGADGVRVLSLLGVDRDALETPFGVHWSAGGVTGSAKLRYAARAAREAILWRPDVVHAAHVNLSGLAVAIAGAVGARTILNTYGREVWSGLSLDASFGLRRSECVMADCHATADYLETEGPRRAGTTAVIWDCVELERFTPAAPAPDVLARYDIPDPTRHFNILTLGRVQRAVAYKGYERLLDVFAGLAPRLPDLRLVVAGSGDLVEPLRERAHAAGVASSVVFTGSVHERDLVDVYRSASLFSLVSDRGHGRGEGIPLTPLEAMACGVPVLVGNQDGSREAVDAGANGFVCDPTDLTGQAAIIERLVQHRELQRELARGATRVARERFSFEAFQAKHEALYASLL